VSGKKSKIDFDALNHVLDDALSHVEDMPDYPKEIFDPFKDAKPGDLVEGEGVYLGKWEPKDSDGNSLHRIFNVFAAPEDLTNSFGNKILDTYLDAVDRVSQLRKWHGHNGAHYSKDLALHKAFSDESYKGEWVIPPLEILTGFDRFGQHDQDDNLAKHRCAGAFNGTFAKETFENKGYHQWYWSSTQSFMQHDHFWSAQFGDNGETRAEQLLINNGLASCRPVRLVEIKP
jgi:hypothetical protein